MNFSGKLLMWSREYYVGVYSLAAKEINTKITPLWAYRQFAMSADILSSYAGADHTAHTEKPQGTDTNPEATTKKTLNGQSATS